MPTEVGIKKGGENPPPQALRPPPPPPPVPSKRCANGVHRECTGQREVKMQPFPCGCECHPRCATCNEPMPTRRTTSRCYYCLNLDVVYPGRHHTTDEQYEEWCGESRS